MDAQGRVTKWEELELGAHYEWCKGGAKGGRHIYRDKLIEINIKGGFIKLANSKFPYGFTCFGWRKRYRKVP